ncbi:CHC2 zinc finger domain-containing protein [Lysobacter sp. CFH 32150]|uniref:CHC2 zinc finger domain-containing protein n=1 Tax=Lysobacter sp. CFH 32150 TaxID=2927128 RepID=UPI001FA71B64|nr:CHC2 zinc finger domain-containing protein [Lysobacter sp. CFH 32150]MCI4567564.1 CHC2 zinc finger domain-containing protein [Lysobacter sp. CFH 32150]
MSAHRDFSSLRALYGKDRIPANWRDRLPDPASYYSQHAAKLTRPNGMGWAQGVCPFHDDHNASLSAQLIDPRGGWRCFAGCGSGDLVGFHMRLTGKTFKDAVVDLMESRA